MSATQRLLGKARLRLGVADLGKKIRVTLLAAASLALAGILLSRLLAFLPAHWFSPITLAGLATAAIVLATAFARRPAGGVVARAVDSGAKTKELFLTAALIQGAPGEYHDVVVQQAEARAKGLEARALVPLKLLPGLRDVAVASALVAAAYLWIPQLDPFRLDQRRQETVKKEQRLEELKKITVAREQELQEKTVALSDQVELALNKLDKTLKEVKPEPKQENAKKLNEEAQDFSELWKKLSEQLPKNAAEQFENAAQGFGDTKQQQALKEAIAKLKEGDAKPLQQALEKMREQMQELAKQEPGPDQKKQMEALAREIAKMSEQLRQQLGEKGMNEALQRALEQMDMAQLKELAKDALDAANQSLGLSEKELERMAEMFKDMKDVQDALKNLQAAKQLNEKGGLDGKDAQGAGAQSQADYEKLYQKLLAERGGGEGQGGQGGQPGQGRGKSGNNPGVGQGGTMGEDPNAKTALKDEKSKSQIGAGKLLMQWKEEGVGEIGDRGGDYQAAVRAIKDGVAEAIRNEQIPPGYHSAIQKYFDRLPAEAPKK